MRRSKTQPGTAPWWTPLTRQRSHRLIDLMLGAFLLVGVAFWLGSLSPILAVGLVMAVAGFYLAGLARGERERRDAVAPPISPVRQGDDALDALDALLANAPPIPLTDLVRVDAGELISLVEAASVEVTALGLPDRAHDLRRAALSGRQVPFTGQRRVDRRRVQKLLDALRQDGAHHAAADDRRR